MGGYLPKELINRCDKLQQCGSEVSSLQLSLQKHLQEPGVPGSVQWHNSAADSGVGSSCYLWK